MRRVYGEGEVVEHRCVPQPSRRTIGVLILFCYWSPPPRRIGKKIIDIQSTFVISTLPPGTRPLLFPLCRVHNAGNAALKSKRAQWHWKTDIRSTTL